MDDGAKILIEFMRQSPNRRKVLQSFQGEAMRPTQIAIATGIHISSVSKCLRQLREHNLVYLINPEYHVPRLYRLTEKGEKILKLIN